MCTYMEAHVGIYSIIVGVCGRTYCRRDRDVTVGTGATTHTLTSLYTHYTNLCLSIIPECITHTHTHTHICERVHDCRHCQLQCKSVCVRALARVLSARGNLLLFIYFTIILFAHDHRRRRRRYIPLNDRSTRTVSAHGRVAPCIKIL